MKWEKLGLISLQKDDPSYWDSIHEYVPTPLLMGDRIRVYFGFWDWRTVKRIGFVDVSAEDPTKILDVYKQPCLNIGLVGTFDRDGVSPSFIFRQMNGDIWLYYFGWQSLMGSLPRYLFAGLAISKDGGVSFERYQQIPILDRLDNERFVRSSLSMLKEEGLYRCWYTSSNKLIDIHGNLVPSYRIYHSISTDGLVWTEGGCCLDFNDPEEFGLSRPWVIKDGMLYKMFYSIRKIDKGYTIGYAESLNGYLWHRKDEMVGINKSESGWDSEMICFPSIVDYEDKRYMFYNGNGMGESGFGVAVLV